MKKIFLVFALSISTLFISNVFAAEAVSANLPVERFALYVGCNDGGKSREQLLYAGSDAYNFQKTMTELGGIPASNSQLLINPDKDDIVHALNGFTSKIERRKKYAKRTEFIFYYSGHSDEDSLLLGTTLYDYSSLKAAITEVPSDVHVVILDSCFSGNFIRAKGGKRSQAFLTDDSTIVQGHAYLSSSSSSESSQESDEIQSSFFTNAMLTGLRGAADTSQDNKVSLNELYYYAFNETISKTQNSVIGPQHPSYNITLVGSGDLILTDISQAESTVIIPKSDSGRFIFRNSRGVLVSEINKQPGNQVSIALESDEYEVTVITENSTKQGKFKLKKNDTYVVSVDLLKKIKRSTKTLRGNEQIDVEKIEDGIEVELSEIDDGIETETDEDAGEFEIDNGVEIDGDDVIVEDDFDESDNLFDSDYFFKFGFVPPLSIVVPSFLNDISISFLVTADEYIRGCGLQLSLIGNYADQKMSGVQLATVYNMAGSVRGLQNSVVVNITRDLIGAQIGLVNVAKKGKGLQLGLINIAKSFSGTQIGFFNLAEHADGFVLGFINYINDGVHEVDFYWDTEGLFTWQWRGGGKELYTTISYTGNEGGYGNINVPYHMESGFGLGAKSGAGFFQFDSELTFRLVVGEDYFRKNYVAWYPSVRETLSFNIWHLGALIGVSFDFFTKDYGVPKYHSRYDNALVKFDSGFHIAPTFYWGFKIN